MALYQYKDIKPTLGKGCYVAPSADVVGDVTLGENVSIWFGVVVRGDVNKVSIGDNTNVQDLSILHVTERDFPLTIGTNVTIGHHVVAHGCTIGDGSLIGMGSILLDGVEIGGNCLVAAGSVCPPGKKYPSGSLIMGSPAKVVRDLNKDELKQYGNHYKSYLVTKEEYLDSDMVKLIDSGGAN